MRREYNRGAREGNSFSSITIRNGDVIRFISLEEVTHFFAEDKYVLLNTLESKQHITSYTLQELENKLSSDFIRVSRSAIVNKVHIRQAYKQFGKRYTLFMKDVQSTKLDTGSRYVTNFLKILT